ncbi:WD40 repeat domain-containing protein [Jiangella alkaliphila]|uniref:Uncharacterized protein n=1 Tax=Jiangella alkaliphila TaxID=419479 RepID=A0A1H2KHD9_9ACTN|nr:hypothetical protein [Jiangella alkaliphila]SDU68109.1 hypothetical protein SAMN04488563_3839 [Jiangella alkaliphila]
MNEFDDLENTLAAELRRRSGEVLGTDDLAARARRKARVVRRRRAVAVAGVTAVALAIAVPAALSLRSVPQTSAPPVDRPTTSETESIEVPDPGPDTSLPEEPSTTETQSPPGEPPDDTGLETPGRGGTTELVLDGLPTGAPPAIGWMEGTTFHRADGRSVQLPSTQAFEPFQNVLELPNGFLATDFAEVADLDATGTVTATRAGAGIVMSSDSALVAYYDQDAGTIQAAQADGGGTGPGSRDVPAGQTLHPIGFLGDYRLVSNVVTEYETAGVRVDDFGPSAGGDTPPTTPPWDLLSVSAVSESAGLVVGYTEFDETEACSAVYEADADQRLWGTCEYSFFPHFSPDGRYLVGSPPWDGEGMEAVVVVDARTGELVHTYTGSFIWDFTFEDEEHVLINVRIVDDAERQAALVRCDFEGACELATPVVQIDQAEDAYTIGLQRW